MNLEQVARRANVSTSTVSRVLNNASVVKSTTRARVIEAIEELKYHPNLHARSLAGGKSRTIGVITSNMENPFFFDIYRTIESDAHSRGSCPDGFAPPQAAAVDAVQMIAEDHFLVSFTGALARLNAREALAEMAPASPASKFAPRQFDYAGPQAPVLMPHATGITTLVAQLGCAAVRAPPHISTQSR